MIEWRTGTDLAPRRQQFGHVAPGTARYYYYCYCYVTTATATTAAAHAAVTTKLYL